MTVLCDALREERTENVEEIVEQIVQKKVRDRGHRETDSFWPKSRDH